jgi:hypothetical protein
MLVHAATRSLNKLQHVMHDNVVVAPCSIELPFPRDLGFLADKSRRLGAPDDIPPGA